MDPKTDWTAWKFWADAAWYCISACAVVFVAVCNVKKARTKEVTAVKDRAQALETRVTVLETEALSKEELGAVHDRINLISDQVSKMDGKMDGVKGTVDMIQEYLLNNGEKR